MQRERGSKLSASTKAGIPLTKKDQYGSTDLPGLEGLDRKLCHQSDPVGVVLHVHQLG